MVSYYRGAMVALVSSCVEAVSFIVTSFAAAVGVVSAKLYSCVALPQACGFKPSRYEPPCRSQRRSFSSGMAPSLFVLRSATQSRLISFRNCWRRGVSERLTLPVGRGGVRIDRFLCVKNLLHESMLIHFHLVAFEFNLHIS